MMTNVCGVVGVLFEVCADNVMAAWCFFLVLTWVHVWANIRALRCLVLSSLNQPRLKLLLQHYMEQVQQCRQGFDLTVGGGSCGAKDRKGLMGCMSPCCSLCRSDSVAAAGVDQHPSLWC
jgi:hypothetical protein